MGSWRHQTRRQPDPPGAWSAWARCLQRQALVALARQLDGAPAAPPEDQLAAALVEARQLAFQLRRIAEDVAPQLRARALALAAAIGDALRAQFGGLV